MRSILMASVFGFFLLAPFATSAQSAFSVQAQIDALLKQIAQLQAQISLLQGSVAQTNTKDQYCASLNRSLARGSVDEKVNGPAYFKGQVSQLQMFLKQYFNISDTSFVDGIFGPNTEKYVVQFQNQNGIEALGIVGPKTRALILRMCTDSAVPTTKSRVLGEQFPQTITLHPNSSYAQAGNLALGAFRIEYVSKNTNSVRITGRTLDGIATQTLNLTTGATVTTNNWPAALKIVVNKINQDGSLELTLDMVSTD